MRYQQHINGDWLSLKNQLKLKYPFLTDFDVNIDEKHIDQISDFGRQAQDDTPAIHLDAE